MSRFLIESSAPSAWASKLSLILEVKVTPKARHDRVEKVSETTFRVWTTAPADKGAANYAVLRLLAAELGLAPSRLAVKRGANSRQKLIEVSH